MLPAGLAELLPGHEVTTVALAGFRGMTNGELLRRAVADRFDVLVTADRGLPAQQNIAATAIAAVLVRGSRMVELAAQADAILEAIAAAKPGYVARLPHD